MKVAGINQLKGVLQRLNLEVVLVEQIKTVNVNKQTKTVAYVALQVRERVLKDKYAGLTQEERVRFDTLVATGIGFNLAQAILRWSKCC